jgi:tetratricopeptide (TPR) repeat protein
MALGPEALERLPIVTKHTVPFELRVTRHSRGESGIRSRPVAAAGRSSTGHPTSYRLGGLAVVAALGTVLSCLPVGEWHSSMLEASPLDAMAGVSPFVDGPGRSGVAKATPAVPPRELEEWKATVAVPPRALEDESGSGAHGVRVARLLSRAQEARVRGRDAQAYRLYARATRIDPTHPDAWRGRGLTAIDEERWDDARSSLRRYLSLEPNGSDRVSVREHLAKL